MTGWYPHVRGHRTLWHLLQPDEPNLLKYLKRAGYYIYWDGGHNDLLATDSFPDSVTEHKNTGGKSCGHNPYSLADPEYHSFLYEPHDIDPEQQSDYAKVLAAREFLRGKPREPFAIYLPLSFPHPPYCAPKPWHERICPDDLPPLRPAEQPGKPDFHALIRQYRRLGLVDAALLRKIQAVYLGMTEFMDHALGTMLDALAETGYAEDTVFLFFADHGDYAGDYGLVEKWPSGLEDVLTRVPLIIRAPGTAAGHVVKEPNELFDITATVLDLAGIEAQHTHFAQSLAPQLGGKPGDPGRAVFAEGGYDIHEPHCFEGKDDNWGPEQIYYPKGLQQQEHPKSICRSTMIRTLTHKLIARPEGVSELYDLASDPLELTNVFGHPHYAGIQAQLTQRLLDWYVHTADVVPFPKDRRGLPDKE